MARRARKDENSTKALRIFFENHLERDSETVSKILCPAHKDAYFNKYPNARGNGEYHPAEDCEVCRG